MIQTVEIRPRKPQWDPMGQHLLRAAQQSGFAQLKSITVSRLVYIQGAFESELVERLLVDPLTEELVPDEPGSDIVDVAFHPGVTDTEADNLVRAAARLGRTIQAATGWRFRLLGGLDTPELERLATNLLANPVVHEYSVGVPLRPPLVQGHSARASVEKVELRELDDAALELLSRERQLALDLDEMRAIREFYRGQGRPATQAELQTLAQTWSEHCVHKTFRAQIEYRCGDQVATVDGLLKSFIRRATEELNRPWVRSAFVDNAGVVAFHNDLELAVKAETHNHPSALEPFGGANTGVGGVIRDVLGVSARPIACTDVLCFAPPGPGRPPQGSLPPARVMDGVVRGVADYGNKMGIPTVSGAVVFHPDYAANPLVYCGCLGLAVRGTHPRRPQPGDLIVVAGGRTGRDGLGGATFSSLEMDATTSESCSTAVQIGNPIVQKLVAEALMVARDEGLYSALTDCGAGGLSSAVGEMGAELGATIELDRVPLKYPGLLPWEIWLSEAQERMVFAVPPRHWERFALVCTERGVEATAIGTFEDSGRLRLTFAELAVGDLPMEFLHHGIPRQHLEACWSPPQRVAERLPDVSLEQALLGLLASPDVCSREPVLRRYDHEVQGQTAVKPLDGAAVLVPLELQAGGGSAPAAVLGCGINPHLTGLDPAAMAWAVVDEAVRNAVAVGADPDRIALLDNFCWGNPKRPDRLGELVRCCEGAYEAALFYGTPFVSGKDSLNNEFLEASGERRAIPGTLLVTALGQVPDWRQTCGSRLRAEGSLLFVLGETRDELGGSAFVRLFQGASSRPPGRADWAPELFRGLHQAHRRGLVRSCQDVSEGGLLVAIAEMCIGASLGATLELGGVPGAPGTSLAALLFSESLSRFVVEVEPERAEEFLGLFSQLPVAMAGTVNDKAALVVRDRRGEALLEVELARLAAAYQGTVFDCLGGEPEVGPAPNLQVDGAPVPAVVGAPRVAVLWAPGTNREREAALACEAAGGRAQVLRVDQLERLDDYAMLVLPGGFSYGDDLGSGRLWALDLELSLADRLREFVDSGRPVLGICNGFQALVRSRILPGDAPATLAHNRSGHFECRWVRLVSDPSSPCLFTRGLEQPIICPVAHGEGRLLIGDVERLAAGGQAPLRYSQDSYPANPNGSMAAIAGVCNPQGNVLGLMPHPEDNVFPWQHPDRRGASGLLLFAAGLAAARG